MSGGRRPGRYTASLLIFVVACGSCGGGADTAGSGSVEVAEQGSEAFSRCLIDHGGIPAGDGVETRFPTGDGAAMQRVWEECGPLLPDDSPRATDAEVRAIYDTWLDEAECLSGLGYEPDPAPSFETFRDSYDTGPWLPTNGVDTGSWSAEQYRTAKDTCTLEFFHSDVGDDGAG